MGNPQSRVTFGLPLVSKTGQQYHSNILQQDLKLAVNKTPCAFYIN